MFSHDDHLLLIVLNQFQINAKSNEWKIDLLQKPNETNISGTSFGISFVFTREGSRIKLKIISAKKWFLTVLIVCKDKIILVPWNSAPIALAHEWISADTYNIQHDTECAENEHLSKSSRDLFCCEGFTKNATRIETENKGFKAVWQLETNVCLSMSPSARIMHDNSLMRCTCNEGLDFYINRHFCQIFFKSSSSP